MNHWWRRPHGTTPTRTLTPAEEWERRWAEEDRRRNERIGRAVRRLARFPDFADMLAERAPEEDA